jgi:hypothetical protein
MIRLRIIGFVIFFLLIYGAQVVLIPADSGLVFHCESHSKSSTDNHSELQYPFESGHSAIEVRNLSQSISEVHKLVSACRLANRGIPVNFDFRNSVFISISINYKLPVSIFIRGHALRH